MTSLRVIAFRIIVALPIGTVQSASQVSGSFFAVIIDGAFKSGFLADDIDRD